MGAKLPRMLCSAALSATFLVVVCVFGGAHASAQQAQGEADGRNNQKVKPFKIIGNIYFVGMTDQTLLLIATPERHILIDTTWERMMPWVLESIKELGFNLRDIRYILNSHSHVDHIDGHAMMKELTGAQVVMSEADGKSLANPPVGPDGRPRWKPVTPNRVIRTGDKVTLGGTTLTAHVFPGHTRGTTTWTMEVEEDGWTYHVVFWGGTSVGVRERYVNNQDWPTIAAEYADSLRKSKLLRCDIYTEPHGETFLLSQKMRRLLAGERPNPFFDPVACQENILQRERMFEERLAKERAESSGSVDR